MLRRTLLFTPVLAIPAQAAPDPLHHPRAVLLLRHAHAPGVGDPPGFRLDSCSTQRNLDAKGQAQARAIGAGLRAAGVVVRVFSSEWCRTLETAELLGLGPVERLALLNSFFGSGDNANAQTSGLRAFIAAWSGLPLLLVTHQVNITALTGVVPADGELVVLNPGPRGLTVASRLDLAR